MKVKDNYIVRDATPEEIAIFTTVTDGIRANSYIPRKDFIEKLLNLSLIGFEESLTWANGSSIPTSISNVLTSFSVEKQNSIKFQLLTSEYIYRLEENIEYIKTAFSLNQDELDIIFGLK